MKKFVSLFLCLTLVFAVAVPRATATIAPSLFSEDIVNVDGVNYSVAMTDDFEIIVAAVGVEGSPIMRLSHDGTARVDFSNANGKQDYITLDFKELSIDVLERPLLMPKSRSDIRDFGTMNIDVHIKDSRGRTYEYDSDKVAGNIHSKDARSAGVLVLGGLGLFGTAMLADFLWALFAAGIVIVVAGMTCYAIEKVIEQLKNNDNRHRYYSATIPSQYNTVFVSPIPITRTHAINRIRAGRDTYTFLEDNAYSVVRDVGLGVIGPEIESENSDKIGIFFKHFHTGNRNGAHSFYGEYEVRRRRKYVY
jgi:hypothetical protein